MASSASVTAARFAPPATRRRRCWGCSLAGTLHAISSPTLRAWISTGALLRQCVRPRAAAPIYAALPAAARRGPARSTTSPHVCAATPGNDRRRLFLAGRQAPSVIRGDVGLTGALIAKGNSADSFDDLVGA